MTTENQNHKRIALITGANQGVGLQVAKELVTKGITVLVGSRNMERGEAAAKEIGPGAIALQIDVTDGASIATAAERIRKEFGRLDLLVNNAGVAPNVRADLLEAGEESFDRLISINLKGPYFLTQQAAKLIADSAPIEGTARAVVNVTSISAYTVSTNRGDYCVAKAGLAMMTKLYAVRLAEYGIGVFEIQPGVIATDMTEGVKEKYDRLFAEGLAPINRWGAPADIGKAVVAIANGHFPYSTGQVFNVDGGFHIHRI